MVLSNMTDFEFMKNELKAQISNAKNFLENAPKVKEDLMRRLAEVDDNSDLAQRVIEECEGILALIDQSVVAKEAQ